VLSLQASRATRWASEGTSAHCIRASLNQYMVHLLSAGAVGDERIESLKSSLATSKESNGKLRQNIHKDSLRR
jgi:hypothetical protein